MSDTKITHGTVCICHLCTAHEARLTAASTHSPHVVAEIRSWKGLALRGNRVVADNRCPLRVSSAAMVVGSEASYR